MPIKEKKLPTKEKDLLSFLDKQLGKFTDYLAILALISGIYFILGRTFFVDKNIQTPNGVRKPLGWNWVQKNQLEEEAPIWLASVLVDSQTEKVIHDSHEPQLSEAQQDNRKVSKSTEDQDESLNERETVKVSENSQEFNVVESVEEFNIADWFSALRQPQTEAIMQPQEAEVIIQAQSEAIELQTTNLNHNPHGSKLSLKENEDFSGTLFSDLFKAIFVEFDDNSQPLKESYPYPKENIEFLKKTENSEFSTVEMLDKETQSSKGYAEDDNIASILKGILRGKQHHEKTEPPLESRPKQIIKNQPIENNPIEKSIFHEVFVEDIFDKGWDRDSVMISNSGILNLKNILKNVFVDVFEKTEGKPAIIIKQPDGVIHDDYDQDEINSKLLLQEEKLAAIMIQLVKILERETKEVKGSSTNTKKLHNTLERSILSKLIDIIFVDNLNKMDASIEILPKTFTKNNQGSGVTIDKIEAGISTLIDSIFVDIFNREINEDLLESDYNNEKGILGSIFSIRREHDDNDSKSIFVDLPLLTTQDIYPVFSSVLENWFFEKKGFFESLYYQTSQDSNNSIEEETYPGDYVPKEIFSNLFSFDQSFDEEHIAENNDFNLGSIFVDNLFGNKPSIEKKVGSKQINNSKKNNGLKPQYDATYKSEGESSQDWIQGLLSIFNLETVDDDIQLDS